MNRINTSNVVEPTLLQPFTANSLDFLQDANKEMIAALCKHIIATNNLAYSSSTPYRLYNVTGTDYVFFNDELYTMTNPGGSTNIATLSTTYPAFDPTLFSDGATSFNVHGQRNLIQTNGTLGTGVFDLVDIVELGKPIQTSIPSYLNGWVANTSPASTPAYTKTFGRVKLSGIVSLTGSITGKQNILQLPAGFLPSEIRTFPCYINDSGTVKSGIVSVDTTGLIIAQTSLFSGSTFNLVSLDSIIFDV